MSLKPKQLSNNKYIKSNNIKTITEETINKKNNQKKLSNNTNNNITYNRASTLKSNLFPTHMLKSATEQYKLIYSIQSINEVYIYPKNTYSQELLKHYIDEIQYSKIISTSSKTMQKAFSLKKQHDILKTPLINKITGLLALVCIALYLACIYLAHQSSTNGDMLFACSVFFIIIGLSLTIWLSFYNFCRTNRKYIYLNEFFDFGMYELFNYLNSRIEFDCFNEDWLRRVSEVRCFSCGEFAGNTGSYSVTNYNSNNNYNSAYTKCIKSVVKDYNGNEMNLCEVCCEDDNCDLNNSELKEIKRELKLLGHKGYSQDLADLEFSKIGCYFYYNKKDRSIEIYSKKDYSGCLLISKRSSISQSNEVKYSHNRSKSFFDCANNNFIENYDSMNMNDDIKKDISSLNNNNQDNSNNDYSNNILETKSGFIQDNMRYDQINIKASDANTNAKKKSLSTKNSISNEEDNNEDDVSINQKPVLLDCMMNMYTEDNDKEEENISKDKVI